MTERDGPFSRWAERKRRVAKDEAEQVEALPVEKPVAEPETEEEEAALLARLELPVPETLSAGDDFSAFMKAGVPEFLRKRALRVLWRSNPVLANLDGLNDYDDDFNSPELTQKVLATAYKVGRGILSDPKEPEAEPETGDMAEVEPTTADDETSAPLEVAESEAVSADAEALPPQRLQDPADEGDAFHPRRMRFET